MLWVLLRAATLMRFKRVPIFCVLSKSKNQRTNGPVKRSPDIWTKHKIKFGSKWPNHF